MLSRKGQYHLEQAVDILYTNMSTTIIQRKEWVDQLRGIGIFLMYFSHAGGWPPLFMFAMMPIFFFLSGYLHKPVADTRKLGDRLFFRLYIPYVIYTVLLQSPKIIIGGGKLSEVVLLLKDLVFGSGAIWFFPCLMSIEVIIYICDRILWIRRQTSYIILSITGLILMYLVKESSFLPWHIDTAMTMIPFYVIGSQYKSIEGKDIQINKIFSVVLLVLYLLISMWIISLFDVKINVSINIYSHPLLFTSFAVLGTYLYMHLTKSFSFGTALTTMGRYSIVLYGINLYCVIACRHLFAYLRIDHSDSFMGNVFCLCTIFVGLVLCKPIAYYFPFMNGDRRVTQAV